MTAEPPRRFNRLAVAVVVAALIIGAAIYASSSTRQTVTITKTSTVTTTISQTAASSYPSGQAYLNVPRLYSDLGYPEVRYTDYTPYLPSRANFTLEYQTSNTNFQVGSVGGDAISLTNAMGLAAQKVGLNPSNYSLAYAAFYPGTIVNSTLTIHPEWYLFFARAYDGFWLFGSYGNGAFSVEADVDALNGTIRDSNVGLDLSNLPASGSYQLNVNSSRALESVRASSLSGVPSTLTKNGTVTSMEPRIVLLGPSSNNAAFQNPLNASLSGEKMLCWVIQLYSPQNGYQGTFAVDAQTGELVSGWAEALYPTMHIESVTGSLDHTSASGLAVSQEAFQINGSIVGVSGSLPATVPNVLVAKPGSTGSIGLNFSSTLTEEVNATFSFANPLLGIESLSSNGVPQGVSFQFETQSLAVPGNGRASTQLMISVAKNAPPGTYLVEVDAILHNPDGTEWGTSGVLFFLSVWDGAGQWPPPPVVR
jgi:hypothetical protein